MLFLPPGSARLTAHPRRLRHRAGDRAPHLVPAQDRASRPTTTPWARPSARRRRRRWTSSDELFDEAVRFVVQSGQASTSMLQRRFRIGFSRAGPAGRHDGARRHHRARRRLQAARDPGGRRLLRDGGQLAEMTLRARRRPRRPLARSGGGVRAAAWRRRRRAKPRRARTARAAPRPRATPRRRGPDRALYVEAQQALATLQGLARARRPSGRSGRRSSLRFRRVVARYPAERLLRRRAARRGRPVPRDGPALPERRATTTTRCSAYRSAGRRVPEQPPRREGALRRRSRSRAARGDRAAHRRGGARRTWTPSPSSARAAGGARRMLKQRAPRRRRRRCPRRRRPGLAQVFNLRFWSGESSTRVVLDVEKQVPIQQRPHPATPTGSGSTSTGTRLHPNLADRSFPVGDGLLEQVRVGAEPRRRGARGPRLQGREGPLGLLPRRTRRAW